MLNIPINDMKHILTIKFTPDEYEEIHENIERELKVFSNKYNIKYIMNINDDEMVINVYIRIITVDELSTILKERLGLYE